MNHRRLFCGLLLSLPLCAQAIVMRHDVDEAKYLSSFEAWPATAYFHFGGRFGSATGTLVAPRWVLTAGHVSGHLEAGDELSINGQKHVVRQAITHPGYRDMQVGHDIGMVELETPSDTPPAALYTGQDEVGKVVTFVGAGRPGNGQTGAQGASGTIRQAHNRVEGLMREHLVFHFDAGEDALPLEGISGPGDSGGPAYLEQDGTLYVIGVSAFQDTGESEIEGVYGVREFYTRVSHYRDWIESVMGSGED